MNHWHHIVPKHAGGTDDSSNLVLLTVEEHAEEHRKLWEQYGRWQDKIAWKALSAQIGREELISEIIRNSNSSREVKKETKDKIRLFNLGKKHSEKTKMKMREDRKINPCHTKKHTESTKQKISEKLKGVVPHNKGKKISKEQKEKIRKSLLGKKHTEKTKKLLSEKSIGNKARTGMKNSESHNKKISLKMKEIWKKRKG